MILQHISILNYKNLAEVDLTFSPKLNCIFGSNGMGKTNLLDAVYYLSFCKSALTPIDAHNIKHGEQIFMLQGYYEDGADIQEEIYCGCKLRQKKHFKRNKKEYTKLSEHIGLIPLVLVSPADGELILGGSEGRRKFIDVVISQYDKGYLDALMRYNKAMLQRNNLLKSEQPVDAELFQIWEEMMSQMGSYIYQKRKEFIENFIPIFQKYYSYISGDQEQVSLSYHSHLQDAPLLSLLEQYREKDKIMGYSLKGIHKDELEMMLGDFPLKREGSQGQSKTYLIALKMAQFECLKKIGKTTPILLLDDIFDKLDSQRVQRIIQLVAGEQFGQIFISDTNREHWDTILQGIEMDYRKFQVNNGIIEPLTTV